MAMHQDDPRLAAARGRWRAAGDRVWAVAVADGEGYRRLVATLAPVLDELRRRAGTVPELLDLDEDPGPMTAGLPVEAAAALERQPALLAAACAIRVDELAGPWAAEYARMRAAAGSRLDTQDGAGSDR